MSGFSRRSLLASSLATPLLLVPAAAGSSSRDPYYPEPDSKESWRSLTDAGQIRKLAGIEVSRLDAAFQYTQTTSQHGGLLVARRGYLVYERYFGRGNREANPNMYSIGKMFTSAACGIMLTEHKDRLPEGLKQRVFSNELLPEAFPLDDPKMAQIKLGHLLTMTSGIQAAHVAPPGMPAGGHQTAIVHGENVNLSFWSPENPPTAQDASAIHGIAMWTSPGAGYLYSRDPHIASMVLRRVMGEELEVVIQERLAKPMGWGRWGYARHHPDGSTMPHTPGEGGIALRATDALRFGYLLLRDGRWKGQQLIPADYLVLCRQPSPYNPHSPFSLQFEVNSDGHVAGAPRDAFFKSGAGGFAIYVIPSLDMVVYKMSSLGNAGRAGYGTYDPAPTGLPLAYLPDTSRDNWKPHPFNQFLDGSIDGDSGVRRTLEMTVAAVCN